MKPINGPFAIAPENKEAMRLLLTVQKIEQDNPGCRVHVLGNEALVFRGDDLVDVINIQKWH